MRRRFVLVTDVLTSEQERQLVAALGSVAWWHHIPNMWLIVDEANQVNTEMLRGLLTAIAPLAKMFASEATEGWWAVRYDTTIPAQAAWFQQFWSSPDA